MRWAGFYGRRRTCCGRLLDGGQKGNAQFDRFHFRIGARLGSVFHGTAGSCDNIFCRHSGDSGKKKRGISGQPSAMSVERPGSRGKIFYGPRLWPGRMSSRMTRSVVSKWKPGRRMAPVAPVGGGTCYSCKPLDRTKFKKKKNRKSAACVYAALFGRTFLPSADLMDAHPIRPSSVAADVGRSTSDICKFRGRV